MIPPFICRYEGDGEFKALPKFHKTCDEHFVVGGLCRLSETEERSMSSHRHYFAAINDAWLSLPDHLATQLPTAEHLRKFALIKTGFHDQRSIACASKAEAQRVAAFIKPLDEFAIVIPSEAVVTVYTAKSQSMKAMGRKRFQESKDAVLGYVADLIGVSREQLSEEAGRAA